MDGTLRDNTVDQHTSPVANERIRTLLITLSSMKNTRIVVWSGGGELYTRQVGASLGLSFLRGGVALKNFTPSASMSVPL